MLALVRAQCNLFHVGLAAVPPLLCSLAASACSSALRGCCSKQHKGGVSQVSASALSRDARLGHTLCANTLPRRPQPTTNAQHMHDWAGYCSSRLCCVPSLACNKRKQDCCTLLKTHNLLAVKPEFIVLHVLPFPHTEMPALVATISFCMGLSIAASPCGFHMFLLDDFMPARQWVLS